MKSLRIFYLLAILSLVVGCVPADAADVGTIYVNQVGDNSSPVSIGYFDALCVNGTLSTGNLTGPPGPAGPVGDSDWSTDANGITYSPVGGGSVAINTPSSSTILLDAFSNDGVANNPVLQVNDNSASGASKGVSVSQAGAKTGDIYGIYVVNAATSHTNGVDKIGLYISSSSEWDGAGAVNYGLYIKTPEGGTTNVGAYIAGVVDMATYPITNLANPTNAQDAATKNYVDSAVSGNVTGYVPTTTTVNGYALSSNVTLAVSDLGLDASVLYEYDKTLVFHAPLWKLYGGATTNPFLSAGLNPHLLTPTGTTWTPQGRTFNGSSDYISEATGVSRIGGQTALTVAIWLKKGANGIDEAPYAIGSTAGYAYQRIYLQSNNLIRWDVGNDANDNYRVWRSSGTFTDTADYHFIVATYNAGTMAVSVDTVDFPGSVVAGTWTGAAVAPTIDLDIGASDHAANFFDGIIGEVWASNTIWSAATQTNVYNATKWRYGL